MARAVAAGCIGPTLITLGIAAVLAGWSAYALSGAGVLPRLPLPWPALMAIAAVYLLRAAALPLMLGTMCDRGRPFLVWSAAIVLAMGIVHAIGIAPGWSALA